MSLSPSMVSREKLAPLHGPKHLLEVPTLVADRAWASAPAPRAPYPRRDDSRHIANAPLCQACQHLFRLSWATPWWKGGLGEREESPVLLGHLAKHLWEGFCPFLKTFSNNWGTCVVQLCPLEFSFVWIIYGLKLHPTHSLPLKKHSYGKPTVMLERSCACNIHFLVLTITIFLPFPTHKY